MGVANTVTDHLLLPNFTSVGRRLVIKHLYFLSEYVSGHGACVAQAKDKRKCPGMGVPGGSSQTRMEWELVNQQGSFRDAHGESWQLCPLLSPRVPRGMGSGCPQC